MLLMAFQKSSSERQHAQMSALADKHSYTGPEAPSPLLDSTWGSTQILYLGFRADHCMGKRKDWKCSRQLPQVKFSCLHSCHQIWPWLKQGSVIPPSSLHNLYCCEIPKPEISITKVLDTMPAHFFLHLLSIQIPSFPETVAFFLSFSRSIAATAKWMGSSQ